jgi:MoaA/NifB/PqqE/SkfB family radical SAM enzyme
MSTQTIIDLIRDLERLGLERIRFTGGEPFLRRDLFEILATIREGQFKKVTIATNGLLLQKYAGDINQSSITDLGVSLDGLRETNDEIRGIGGYFELVLKGIAEVNKRVTIMTTLNQKNAYELEGLFDICEEQGAMWDFNLLDDHLFFLKGTNIDEIWPDEKAVDFMMNSIQKNLHRPVLKRLNKLQLEYAEKYLKRLPLDEPPCYLGYTDIDIDSAGNLWSGCYVLHPVGNILESNLHYLLRSDTYANRLKKMRKRQCPGCSCGYELNISIQQLPRRALEYFIKQRKK